MKFLAILRDSLREAIDTKVFYVMVGLSLLLIALGFSCTFKPRPGGEFLMKAASFPLNMDLTNLDLENPEPELLLRRLGAARGLFQVTSVAPVEGEADAPTSTFRVQIQARLNPLAGLGSSESLQEHITRAFGVLDRWRIAEVVAVKRCDAPLIGGLRNPFSAEFEVLARVAPAGRRLWPYDFSLFFGALPFALVKDGVPLALQLFALENYLINGFGAWVAILVSIVITAFFIPNMLRKGTVDLLLVKPIHRTTLLLYKYVGGLLFILLNTAVAVVGVWLALSLRSGIWAPAFLVSIPIITFFFAILYSVSALFGVLTRSPIVAILLTCAVWLGLFVVGVTHVFVAETRKKDNRQRLQQAGPVLAGMAGIQASPLGQGPLLALAAPYTMTAQPARLRRGHDPENPFGNSEESPLTRPILFDNWFTRSVAALHFILPRTHDLDDLTKFLLLRDLVFSNRVGTQKFSASPISWTESLTVSGIFIAIMLGLACWRFATRDY